MPNIEYALLLWKFFIIICVGNILSTLNLTIEGFGFTPNHQLITMKCFCIWYYIYPVDLTLLSVQGLTTEGFSQDMSRNNIPVVTMLCVGDSFEHTGPDY